MVGLSVPRPSAQRVAAEAEEEEEEEEPNARVSIEARRGHMHQEWRGFESMSTHASRSRANVRSERKE